jgi:WD40 repeat protein
VLAIKYSPQGNKFASGGSDGIIHVWSKDGKLLIEIKGHDKWVTSLCWSKDGKNIFSGSADHTIRTWQSIDGKELVVIRGHTNPVRSLCPCPDESHLVSASDDYSVRIWDLETNQQVGDPLWHDDQVNVVAMSSDGQYFTSGISGPHAKIYVWSLEAALERARGLGVRVYITCVSIFFKYVCAWVRMIQHLTRSSRRVGFLFFHTLFNLFARDVQLQPEMCAS